jgi:LmbE family N-acetylglucosaminyl deacetylase
MLNSVTVPKTSSSDSRPPATVLISPHVDDIAYSVGGAVLAGFFPPPLLMVIPFTLSISAEFFDGSHDIETVTTLRKEEDYAFSEKVGCQILRLKLPEATVSRVTGHYYYPLVFLTSIACGWPEPRGTVTKGVSRVASRLPRMSRSFLLQRAARIDPVYSILRERISSIISKQSPVVLVSPLGLGNHPNHIVLSRVCRSLKDSVSRLYFYEDLPYSSSYRLPAIEMYVKLFDGRLRPVSLDIGDLMEKKLENLSIYKSQVDHKNVARVLKHARALSDQGLHERMWTY